MESNIFAKYAPAYLEKGFSIIPVKGKKPEVNNWSTYCLEHPSKELFEHWVEHFSDSGIGLCLGKASQLTAFDFDIDDVSIQSLVVPKLPLPKWVKAGQRGWTAFYKYSGGASRKLSIDGVHIADLLSDGKQTVLPPSIHPNTGTPYRWLTAEEIEHVFKRSSE